MQAISSEVIRHHQQRFYESAAEALASESQSLSELIGVRLEAAWLATDSDGAWFNDEPALLQFGNGRQLEIGVYQVGLLALTWDTVDTNSPANWLGCWSQDLKWELAAMQPWASVCRQQVQRIQLVDYDSDFGRGAFGVQFEFDSGQHLLVYNALDELGVDTTPVAGDEYHLHQVAV